MPETLEFENPRALQALYANDLRLLKTLEEALKVKVTTREGWVRLEGEPENIEKARRVFQQLDTARKSGVEIRRHEFDYALRSVCEPGQDGNGSNGLGSLVDSKITLSPRRAPIVPKTAGQRNYLQLIDKHDIVFGIGPAGTGKTYLAMAMAVSALKREQVTRIILTRPAVEAGEALGFLPGDLNEKIFPYLRPLYDALGDMLEPEEMQRQMDRGVIEVAPLAYMRGRTLSRAFIVLDEAQNTTTEQMFMFLTRLGPDSKCIVTGDQTQIDLPNNKRSGLIEAMQALKGVEGIAFQFFEERDVVRHQLVQSIVRAYKHYRGVKGSGAERP
jgi:phosphate starvation-inducible PhoH-like protein